MQHYILLLREFFFVAQCDNFCWKNSLLWRAKAAWLSLL
jgi:hypothetical protein